MESIMMEGFTYKMWRNADIQLHRDDGPAIEWANGSKEWWVCGKLHRDDGPAIECANGDKEWWICGKLHRDDGPAVEKASGRKEWHICDKRHTKKTYFIKIKNLILEKIGSETANMFGFGNDDFWKNSDAIILADFLEEQDDIKTANQIRNLIKFASSVLSTTEEEGFAQPEVEQTITI